MTTLLKIFKKTLWLTLLSLIIYTGNVAAQTEIPAGDVSGTWTLANSPYRVNGHITVPNDSLLTIEPGVKVIFTGSYKLDVKGRVIAVGSATDTITFTAENHTTGWQSVKFMDAAATSDSSRFVYCKMEYGNLNQGGDLDRSGGAFAIMNFSKLLISHCLLQNNTVVNTGSEMSGGGGAIGIINASPKITNNTIINNQCTGPYGAGGAIICWSNANPLIANNLISGNTAYFAGGIYVGLSQPHIINNIITENTASGRGGGIHGYNSGNPVIINNTIVNNWGNYGGGLDFNVNCKPEIINSIIYGNSATVGNQVTLQTTDCDPDFVYCLVQDGKGGFGDAGSGANYNGLYIDNISCNPGFLIPESDDFSFSDDSYCISAGADSVQVNSTWYYAPATDFEGNPRPCPTGTRPDLGAMENVLGYENPVAPETTVPAGDVKGTWTYENSPYKINGDITIPDGELLSIEPGVQVVFTGHYKFNVQGRLLAIGTKQDTIVFSAQDTSVGWHGIRYRDTPNTNDSSKIMYCSLKYGKANSGDDFDRCGGALLVKGFNKLFVSNCLFSSNMNNGNMAIHGGGAVGILSCSPVFENNIISYNKAVGNHGGGICIAFSSNPVIRNNVICNNHAVGGGGLLLYQSNPVFINNTIVYNHSDLTGSEVCHGGAACIIDCSPKFINTIIFGNTATVGNQFNLQNGSQLDFYHCDIEGGKENFSRDFVNGGSFSGVYEYNIESDPLFADTASGDFRLSDDSPCISHGVDSVEVNGTFYYAPVSDMNGKPRPNPIKTTPDIGAIENSKGQVPTDLIKVPEFDAIVAQLFQNYPNPFTTTTEIPFSLPCLSYVKLQVLDCVGRVVEVLTEEEMQPENTLYPLMPKNCRVECMLYK